MSDLVTADLPHPPGANRRDRWRSILGVGSEAQLELLHLNLRGWRVSLAGASLVNLLIAWVFTLFAPASSLWVWASLGWMCYGAQGLLCWAQEQWPANRRIRLLLVIATLVLSLLVGVLWSSLAWWLPATPSIQLFAALAAGMVMLGSASSSVSVGTLFAVGLPMVTIVPAALLWHAHLPAAAAVALGMNLLIWQHGLSLHKNMLAAIHRRREIESLSEQLRLKQAQLHEAESARAVLTERQRLLREMHDGLGASLISALRMTEEGRMTVEDAAQLFRECLDDLRLVIDSLEPIDHDLVSLLATLRYRLGSRLENAGIAIEWNMADDLPALPWMGAPQSLELLRVAQETLANILKHARASRVRFSLTHESAGNADACLVLRIEDNGVGFDPNKAVRGRGLAHMRLRVARVMGKLDIDTSPGHGTKVNVHLPLNGPGSG